MWVGVADENAEHIHILSPVHLNAACFFYFHEIHQPLQVQLVCACGACARTDR
jgi:hypothetical protein